MLTNPTLGEGKLDPNEPIARGASARTLCIVNVFDPVVVRDLLSEDTKQAVAEMAERTVRGRDLRPWTFESKPINQLDWFEQLLGGG